MKKRTVITTEKHEVWVLRNGELTFDLSDETVESLLKLARLSDVPPDLTEETVTEDNPDQT